MSDSSAVGRKLGKYQLRAEIGQGGMGTVYLGYDPLLDRQLAIKVLAPHLVWEKEFVERFLREARAAARLKHPNIVTIHDVGHEGGWYYFVMEYLPGETLATRLKRQGAMSTNDILNTLRPLAGALDYAHQRGIIHRDVKPSNVVIGEDGHATLTDFGIARAAQESRLTSTGKIMGTPEYMSPEQAKGLAVDARSDQYSLAVVAYQMFSGQVPFQADSTPALMYKVVHEPPPPLTHYRPDLPPAMEKALARGLAKEPEARYPTVSAFVQSLRQALGAVPGRARPKPAAVPAAKRTPARRPFPLVMVAGIALLFLCAIGLLVVGGIGLLSTLQPPASVTRLPAGTAETRAAGRAEAQATATANAKATTAAKDRTAATAEARATATAKARARTPTPVQAVLFQDDFSSNANDWPVGEHSTTRTDAENQVVDGKYRKSVTFNDDASQWSFVPDFSARDFSLTVDATIAEASDTTRVAIIFRYEDIDNYYYVRFSNSGKYEIQVKHDGEWTTIQDWTASDAFNPKDRVRNSYSVLVTGPRFTLYANGRELATVEDTALSAAGKIGLGVSGKENNTAIVDFDNLVIKEAP